MKNKEKKVVAIPIIGIIIVIAIICGVVFLNKGNNTSEEKKSNQSEEQVDKKEEEKNLVSDVGEGIKLNRNENFKKEIKIGNLVISNMQLTTKNGMSTLLGNVTNNGSSKSDLKIVGVNLLDENGNTLINLTGIIEPIEAGGTSQLNISMTSDYINACDFEVFEK